MSEPLNDSSNQIQPMQPVGLIKRNTGLKLVSVSPVSRSCKSQLLWHPSNWCIGFMASDWPRNFETHKLSNNVLGSVVGHPNEALMEWSLSTTYTRSESECLHTHARTHAYTHILSHTRSHVNIPIYTSVLYCILGWWYIFGE